MHQNVFFWIKEILIHALSCVCVESGEMFNLNVLENKIKHLKNQEDLRGFSKILE